MSTSATLSGAERILEAQQNSECLAAEHLSAEHLSAERLSAESERLTVFVSDIKCGACALKIEAALLAMPNILACRANAANRIVLVEGTALDRVVPAIRQLGFDPKPVSTVPDVNLEVEARSLLARLGVAGIGMMQVMMFALATYIAGEDGIDPAYVQLMHWASFMLATPVALYSAMVFHEAAWRDLRHAQLGMDVPVSLAILSAYGLSVGQLLAGNSVVYFDSVCMFTFLLLVGRYVEFLARRRYQENLGLGEHRLPDHVRCADGSVVPLALVNTGDLLSVEPGEIISVDGLIRQGQGSVNEAAFTGESLPVFKQAGSKVLAGSVNLDGLLQVEATCQADDSLFNKMRELQIQAMAHKPPFSVLADRVARYFVAVILTLAMLAGGYWFLAGAGDWFVIMLTVLVVSCPCALSLATPVAYTVAVTSLARQGLVVSSGEFLEKLGDIQQVVFDKTGTLTEGNLQVAEILPVQAISKERVQDICAALEAGNRHPVAMAFEFETSLRAREVKVVPGAGVEGCIDKTIYRLGKPEFAAGEAGLSPPGEAPGIWILLAAESPLAWVRLVDTQRPEAGAVIASLQKNRTVLMATGDRRAEAERIAGLLGIAQVYADQSPSQKLELIRQLQADGKRVLMVGDGINDAAAMALADAAIAVNPVDIVVQASAGATLLRRNIEKLPALLTYGAMVKRVIRQNLIWAAAYNLTLIPLAMVGLLAPWMAALGMSVSSILVVLNASRLRQDFT